MTSTTQGTFTDKNSSRVLRPPGGASSNIFGFADDAPKPTKKTETTENEPAAKEQQIGVNAAAAATADTTKTENQSPADENNENAEEARPTDTAVASAKERELIAKKSKAGSSGFNPITGEPVKESGTDGAKQNARVRNPPGGASSKLW